MTLSRRFFRFVPGALVVAAGFASGCTNFDRFTAGRLPYGGLAENNAPRDPFLGQSDATRVASASGATSSSTPAQPTVAQTSWNGQAVTGDNSASYGTPPQTAMQQPAYPQQQPYAQASAYPQGQPYDDRALQTAQPQGYAPPQGHVQQTAYPPQQSYTAPQASMYQAPPASRPENPFATESTGGGIQQMSYEMPAAPPANPFADIEGSPVGTQPAPVYRPTTSTGTEQWQSTPTATSYPPDAFLPPVQR